MEPHLPSRVLTSWYLTSLPLSIAQVSLLALRVAVGMVSHVDLPLDDLLAAVVRSASTEMLDGVRMSTSASGHTAATPSFRTSAEGDREQEPQRLQKDAYTAMCKFMQRFENPPTRCCGSRFRCSTCGSTRSSDCYCVSWRAGMVRVQNGKGGLVWVKNTNEEAYAEKIAREAELTRRGQHA